MAIIKKYLDLNGLETLKNTLVSIFCKKTDLNSHSQNSTIHMSSAEKSKLTSAYNHSTTSHAPINSEKNTIVTVQKNGTDVTIDSNRKVNIIVPTKTSELTNDSGYTTKTYTTGTSTTSGTTKLYTSVGTATDGTLTRTAIANNYAKKSIYDDTNIKLGRTSGSTVGVNSHTLGESLEASGIASVAVNGYNKATGRHAFARNSYNEANGDYSDASGHSTKANGVSSHSEGEGTIASGQYQHVEGKYNVEDTNNTYAHIVGGGTSSLRKNIYSLDWNGNATYTGNIIAKNIPQTPSTTGSEQFLTTKGWKTLKNAQNFVKLGSYSAITNGIDVGYSNPDIYLVFSLYGAAIHNTMMIPWQIMDSTKQYTIFSPFTHEYATIKKSSSGILNLSEFSNSNYVLDIYSVY